MGHKLSLYIQPVYNYSTDEIEYAEILVRKYRGIDGVERIMKFINRNNSYDIFDIDVLKETLYILKSIPDLGYPVGINLCSKSLEVKDFAKRVVHEIKSSGLDKNKIIIEINEYTNFSNSIAIDNMRILSDNKLKLALDDFGIGNTNVLSFINTKFDYIKIDKELINIDDNWNHKKFILGHMKEICDTMNIKTVVEGIETSEQLGKMRELGYDTIQGYIIAKPLDIKNYFKIDNSNVNKKASSQ